MLGFIYVQFIICLPRCLCSAHPRPGAASRRQDSHCRAVGSPQFSCSMVSNSAYRGDYLSTDWPEVMLIRSMAETGPVLLGELMTGQPGGGMPCLGQRGQEQSCKKDRCMTCSGMNSLSRAHRQIFPEDRKGTAPRSGRWRIHQPWGMDAAVWRCVRVCAGKSPGLRAQLCHWSAICRLHLSPSITIHTSERRPSRFPCYRWAGREDHGLGATAPHPSGFPRRSATWRPPQERPEEKRHYSLLNREPRRLGPQAQSYLRLRMIGSRSWNIEEATT